MCAEEIGLKFLELTAGKVAVLVETFLGLRHGPLSFLDRDALVFAILSTDARTRAYEEDLLAELRAKRVGRLIGLAPPHAIGDSLMSACRHLLPICPIRSEPRLKLFWSAIGVSPQPPSRVESGQSQPGRYHYPRGSGRDHS